LYKRVQHDKVPREDAVRDFFGVVASLGNELLENQGRLSETLRKLQGTSGQMRGIEDISGEIIWRNVAIAKYTKAVDTHRRVSEAIREGFVLHSSLSDSIAATSKRVHGFVAARELAAKELEHDVQRKQEERERELKAEEEARRLLAEQERVQKEEEVCILVCILVWCA
jgi:hypothetical protein